MFTSDEGEGWQQLGEGLMPQSSGEAGAMLDGLQHMGEQTVHGLLGGTSMPDLKDALGAMYGSKPMQVGDLPQVDFFDSSSSGSMLSGAEAAPTTGGMESAAVGQAPAPGMESASAALQAPTGAESAIFQTAPAGSFEPSGLLSTSSGGGMDWTAFSSAPAGSFEPSGLLASTGGAETGSLLSSMPGAEGASMLAKAPAGAFEAASAQLQAAGPGTVETLHTPADGSFQPAQGATGADASAGLSDATSPVGDIGKAITDMVGKMTDMIGSLAQGPMGLLGSLLNFLLTIFTEILSQIGTAMAETARAAASLAAEAWKKHLEMAT